MRYYFEKPFNSKKYSGRQRITLPVRINEDLKNCEKANNILVTNFETINDLNNLKVIASGRNEWKKIVTLSSHKREGCITIIM